MSTIMNGVVERDKPTTEWDDIQRRIGNLPPLEQKKNTAVVEALEAVADNAGGSSTNAGDDNDDNELARLRAERLDELKGGSGSREPRFGTVAPLSREDYKKEVNEAGDGVGVVVFLSKSKGHYLSSYTLVLLEQLARKFSDVKFLRIESTDCIPGYPDGNLPTLLIYRDDELLRQCTGPSAFGGKSFSIDSVEWELAQSGIIKTEIGKCPHEKPSTATRPAEEQ